MLWRTLQWLDGRLARCSQIGFWKISRTFQDPSIPNLPMETPPPSGGGMLRFATMTGGMQEMTGGMHG